MESEQKASVKRIGECVRVGESIAGKKAIATCLFLLFFEYWAFPGDLKVADVKRGFNLL